MFGSLRFNPAVAENDVFIVDLYNLQEHDSFPLTVTRYRTECAEAIFNHRSERFVATNEDHLAGFGSFHWAWWTGQPGTYAVDIRVDPRFPRQRIGTGLYDLMHSRLLLQQTARLVGWVRTDAEDGRHFAAHLRFGETGQVVQEYRLHIPDARTDALAGIEERLAHDGLRIASLSELARDDGAFLRA